MPINPIAGVGAAAPAASARPAASSGAGFAEHLESLVQRVNETTADANAAVTNMIEQKADPYEAMIALHHAETALQLTVQVRNKLVNAYQDIMRMPV